MQYEIKPSASKKFIDIKITLETQSRKIVKMQLPAWRPGRYELGNFAKNIRLFKAYDANKNELAYKKITKDLWEIETLGNEIIHIYYQYYANELNAGSSFVNDELLYVNPVNCLMYDTDYLTHSSIIHINVPDDYKIACSLKRKGNKLFEADNFHELADSPFIASANLQSNNFTLGEYTFHICIQGECRPDWNKILTDFSAFTKKQISAFKEFPVKEYYFLIHALPYNFYHGVEHLASSVNVLGPAHSIMNERYNDLLGLCSHELYHAWNIKSIRPKELLPYDYTRENYFKTGYVAEGVTTYMGDYFLLASGVFDTEQFLKEFSAQVQKHIDNYGRFNYSVAESSFDSWLDGYSAGVPARKVSIYTEGFLLAFMADILIRKNTNHEYSLHNVMHELYYNFYKKNIGYTDGDYKKLLEKFSGISFDEYFEKLVNGTHSYFNLLNECLLFLGLELKILPALNCWEKNYGIKYTEQNEKSIITAVHPELADKTYINTGDQIIAINNHVIKNDLNKWFEFYNGNDLHIQTAGSFGIKNIKLDFSENTYYKQCIITVCEKANNEQIANLNKWRNL